MASSAQELAVVFETVSSSSLAITAGQLQGVAISLPDLPHPPGGPDNLVAATAGQFDGNPADAELMVLVGKKPPVMAVLLDVSATLVPTIQATVDLPSITGDSAGNVAYPLRITSGASASFEEASSTSVSTVNTSTYRARTYFRPETCGPHTLVAVAAPERAAAAVSQHVTVDVTVEAVEAVEALMASTRRLDLAPGNATRLLTPLESARTAFQQGLMAEGGQQLLAFEREVAGLGGKVTSAQADVLLAQARLFRSCLVDGQLAATLTRLSGSATRVGDSTDSAQVKIAGRFTLSPANGALDLAIARVSIQSLLAETGGAGELVDRVAAGPVQLVPRKGSKSTSATYESQPTTARPGFRMDVKQRPGGVVEFDLKVDRAVLSRDPTLCSAGKPSTTGLVTRFTIEDDLHSPLAVATTRAWECVGRQPTTPSELKLR